MKLTKTNLQRSAIAGIVASTLSVPVIAGKSYYSNQYANSAVDYAKVVQVDPIYETYQVNQPVEQCYHKKVPVKRAARHNSYRNKSKTPEILGAIIGGVVGNQVGKRGGGKARDVATVAGAVLGGSIGRDIKHQNSRKRHYDRYEDSHYSGDHYKTVKHCDVKDHYVTEQKLVGYDVAYKYRGNVFHTQMDYDPGAKIKVKVTVDPV